MEAGTIVKWLKSEGEHVEKGEPLYEIDTDKVTQEVESDFSGVLLKIALSSGEAPVGQTIAFIGEEGEEVQDAGAAAAESAEQPAEAKTREPEPEPEPEREAEPQKAAAASNGGRIKASPLARRIA